MTPQDIWNAAPRKLIAILRGVRPDEIAPIADALLEAGFPAIEVPLNSPDPFTSIAAAAERAAAYGPRLIGAGTVLEPEDVARVKAAGGNLIVSPNVDPRVVTAALEAGMACFPGVFTATEAHLAVRLGATGLKFFPAAQLGAAGIKAIAATLPAGTSLCAVGGIGPAEIPAYRAAGVEGFGLGSSLYRPGATAADVAAAARESMSAMG
ncbi:MAG: 2-dehydro-3-deoxy-6-phosphogalactonate aldolase [Pseudomonadota bacterium]